MITRALAAWDVLWQGCAAYSAAGATVVQRDRIRWFATGVGYEGLNGVFVGPGTHAGPVEDAMTNVSPPAGAGAVARRPWTGRTRRMVRLPGLSWYEEEPLMVARLGSYELPNIPRLSVFTADQRGISDWVRIWSGRDSGGVFQGLVAGREPAARARLVHLVAVLAGEPVGCAAVFIGRGAAEVQHVVTVPEMRGRGIGTAMTVAALRTAAARGLDTAVLTSSPDGLRIYQRLGFRPVGRIRRYLWSPSSAGNAITITHPDGARNINGSSNDVAVRDGYPALAWVQRPVYALVAQRTERETSNLLVAGSSPAGGAALALPGSSPFGVGCRIPQSTTGV